MRSIAALLALAVTFAVATPCATAQATSLKHFTSNTYVVVFPDGGMAAFNPDDIPETATSLDPWPIPNGRGLHAAKYVGTHDVVDLVTIVNTGRGVHETQKGPREPIVFRGLYVYNTGKGPNDYAGLPGKRQLPRNMRVAMLQREYAKNGRESAEALRVELDTSYILIGSGDGLRPDPDVSGSKTHQWLGGSELIPVAQDKTLFAPPSRAHVDAVYAKFRAKRLCDDVFTLPRYRGLISYFGDQRSPRAAKGIRADFAHYLRYIDDRTGERPNDCWYFHLAPRMANELTNLHYCQDLWMAMRYWHTKRLQDLVFSLPLVLGKCSFGLSRHPDSKYFGRWHGEKGYKCVGDSSVQPCPPTKQFSEGLVAWALTTRHPFLLETLRFKFEGTLLERDRKGQFPHFWAGDWGARIAGRYLEELLCVIRWAPEFGWDDLAEKAKANAIDAANRYLAILDDGRPYWINNYSAKHPKGKYPTSPWMQSQLVTALINVAEIAGDDAMKLKAVDAGLRVWADARFEFTPPGAAEPVLMHHYRSGPTVKDDYISVERGGVFIPMMRKLAHERPDQCFDDFERMVADFGKWIGTSPKRNAEPKPQSDVGIADPDRGVGHIKTVSMGCMAALN